MEKNPQQAPQPDPQDAYAKEFGQLARLLPHIFARWRSYADFETLADLPDGRIEIDALAGTARHGTEGPIGLAVSAELKAGLEGRLGKKGIPQATLAEATVTVLTDTKRIRTDRRRVVHFDFRIACRIRTRSADYEGAQEEEHVWHSREPEDGPSG
jgi:hypothetical protein